jgi:DNA (cytosine-5)-methyltransferase 1
MVGEDVSYTLATRQDQTLFEPVAFAQHTRDEVRMLGGDGSYTGALAAHNGVKQQTYVLASGQANAEMTDDGTSPTLTCLHESPIVIDRAAFNQGDNALYQAHIAPSETMDTIVARGPHALAVPTDGATWIVRRLTPTECERLQGFPDGYTDIGEWIDGRGRKRKSSDTNRYKALGNSFTVNVVRWIGERIGSVA